MGLVEYPPTYRLASLYACAWRIAPVNAREFLSALTGLPGARAVPVAGEDIAESRLVAGIEIARVSAADERALRRIWRQRAGKGADPLLLVADDPERENGLRTLGPRSESEPIRLVVADDLLRIVQRLPSSRLQAVRMLAEELEQLDQTGVAGLVVRGLGTEYLYTERLPKSPRWALLSKVAEGVAGEWRDVLKKLGYELEQLPVRGYVARASGKPVAVVWPVSDPSAFSKLDSEGRPPEGLVINLCDQFGARYGLLVAGSRFRLFEAKPASGSSIARYLELDAATLPEEHRALLALLAPDYLADGAFEALMNDARESGVKMRKRLDESIRQRVLPVLGIELGHWAKGEGLDLADDNERQELEAAALTFVFRALFLLYAESAGHLPIAQDSYRPHSFKQIVRDAAVGAERLDTKATSLYLGIRALVEAMRTGNTAWSVPGYNGDLFAADGFQGAEVLERATIPDSAFGPALVALGIDPETGDGFDFSGLEIGHLGHIYEGLLSLRLSVADRDYRYDARSDRYVTVEADEADVHAGDLLWLTDEGGRKGGGVYYTPEPLVRHLVRLGVIPAFESHLKEVATCSDRAQAARRLFEFRVLDPACGSAHFLVAVVDELADQVARFLARTPLPAVRRQLDDLRAGAGETYGVGVEDVALLRRLVLKHCVYGVDISPMGAEIAKISLWLASFVPGLSLTYLDHNVRIGNSLIGVASADQLVEADGSSTLAATVVLQAMDAAAETSRELLDMMDRTPDEVESSAEADREVRERSLRARRLLDAWIAEPLGLPTVRTAVMADPEGVADGTAAIGESAEELATHHLVFHWPVEFPEVFAGQGGFDAVVGNPPWEEITVEELAFYARYQPGLRGLPQRERDIELENLKRERPELAEQLEAELRTAEAMREFFRRDSGYESGAGDPDLYKFFCQRYRPLLRPEGSLAVVLARSAFGAKGSTDFRRWLFTKSVVERIDFLLNSGRWAFDAEPRYTSALLLARMAKPDSDHRIEVLGVADSLARFIEQSKSAGPKLDPAAFGLFLEVPLVASQAAADLLPKLHQVRPFPFGCGRWQCFAVGEFHETNDRRLWANAGGGRELWKGESFDQYDPRGSEVRLCPTSKAALAKQRKPRPGKDSLVASDLSVKERAAAVLAELDGARVAFRDVSRATDSRTVRAALVPPDVFLTNKAPYLAFVKGGDLDRACCLGLLNSLVFDWQARRFVETNVNFFILEGLRLPDLTDEQYLRIARAAARLSCSDDRFAVFAESTGVECGPLHPEERDDLRAEIDALVARAYGLDAEELELVFSDFTFDAVSEDYRQLVRRRFAELE